MMANEKVYKTMTGGGAATLTIGIITTVVGVVTGILLIIHGALLLKERRDLMI